MDAHKLYTSKPARAIDLDIYVGSSFFPVTDWSDDQLEDYASRLRDALTANGNTAVVDLEESNISIFADANGDNDRFFALIDEGYAHGRRVGVLDRPMR